MTRGKKSKALNIRFFNLPVKNAHKRGQWLTAINRKNWKPDKDKEGYVVCSRHFVSGQPSKSLSDVDYRPTKYMKGGDFDIHVQQEKTTVTTRRKRATKRKEAACARETAEVIVTINLSL
jgi:hypothetical protein